MQICWTARPEKEQLQRRWDGEAVIYGRLSGSTHYLDSIAVAVLDRLRVGPMSAEEVARAMCAEFDAGSETDVLAAVQETLANLRQMDLIQPADF